MMNNNIWSLLAEKSLHLVAAPMPPVTELRFDRTGVACQEVTGQRLLPDAGYFGVSLNEVCLAKGREWWSTYEPLVYCEVTYRFGSERIVVPKVLGASALKLDVNGKSFELPHGFVTKNIQILPAQPFQGGAVELKFVLYKAKQTDYCKKFLKIIDSLSQNVGFIDSVAVAAKMANVLVDAISSLFDLGDCEPVLGHHIGLNSALDGLREQSIALLSGSAEGGNFTVFQNQLASKIDDAPLRRDYLLYSLWSTSSPDPGACESKLRSELLATALKPNEESWVQTKAMLLTYYQELLKSPNLLPKDADRLFEEARDRVVVLHDHAKKASLMSVGQQPHVMANIKKLDLATNQIMAL